jgi:uncharacterized protein (TIGR02270 family)
MLVRNDLLPRWDIHEEHLDEAAFFWMQWERALLAPDFDLGETAELEHRLWAHLAGLAEGGAPVARRLLQPALGSDEPERISSAALSLMSRGGAEATAELIRTLEGSAPEQRAALQRALELTEGPACAEQVRPLLSAPEPELQVLALEVLAFRGVALGRELDALLVHEEPGVRAAALRCARLLPPERVRAGELRAALAAPHPAVRLEAITLGLIHGARAAWPTCLELAQARQLESREACVLLALGGGDEELRLLLGMLAETALQADVLWALGFSGRVAAAQACLELMCQPETAALAAEAFSAITGLSISGQYAAPAPAAREPPPLEEDELDADLEPRPEDDLAAPVPEAVATWWQQACKGFDKGTRYLAGQPFSASLLQEMLGRESMRRRHVLALELAIRSRGAHQLQTRTLARRQLVAWEQARASQGKLSPQPLPRLPSR